MSRKSYVATSALVTISKKKDKISKLSERSNMCPNRKPMFGHITLGHYTLHLGPIK